MKGRVMDALLILKAKALAPTKMLLGAKIEAPKAPPWLPDIRCLTTRNYGQSCSHEPLINQTYQAYSLTNRRAHSNRNGVIP